jgi:Mg2+/Co2+ transporter CorB
MQESSILILVILLSLTASAFFSGTEIAFVTANRLKIELDRSSGNLSGRILARFVKKPEGFHFSHAPRKQRSLSNLWIVHGDFG